MLFTYGKLHSITKSKFSWSTGFLRFKANRPKKSLVVVNLAADDLKVVTNMYDIISNTIMMCNKLYVCTLNDAALQVGL